jgi:hypothetical protein
MKAIVGEDKAKVERGSGGKEFVPKTGEFERHSFTAAKSGRMSIMLSNLE